MPRIEAIVFDIGRVLVHLDFDPILGYFAEYGIDVDHLGAFLERIDLPAYERGEFDGEELLSRIAALGNRPMALDALRAHWNGIFVPQSDMLDLVRRLSDTHRVYLLSNIGDLHWDHLERELAVSSLGHGALPSFQARVAKPDAGIYRRAEELFGLQPARTVFVDDLLPNVDAARQRGWRAIHHHRFSATVEDLRALGIRA